MYLTRVCVWFLVAMAAPTAANGAILDWHSQLSVATPTERGGALLYGSLSPEPLILHDEGTWLRPPRESWGSATAIVRPTAMNLLGVEAAASATSIQGFDMSADAGANALWRDIAFVDVDRGPITLHFQFSGDIGVTPGSSGWLAMHTGNDVLNAYPSGDARTIRYDWGTFVADPTVSIEGDFDSLSLEPLAGSFHVVVPYDETFGGYDFFISFAARVGTSSLEGRSSSAIATSLRSLGLTAVTDASGNELNPTFDSGLSLQADVVPEPASFILWALGGVGGAFAYRRRAARRGC